MSHRAICMVNHVQWTIMYVKSNIKYRQYIRLYLSPAAGVCQCPSGPGYMSVPIRANLSVRAHQGQVIMSVPSRARLLCQCPAGPGYYVSAQQGQVIMSVPSRARLLCQCPAGPGLCQCPAGPCYYVSAQQGQVSVPSRANSAAGVVYLRVTASMAVVSAPHQSTNRAQYPTRMRRLVHLSNHSQGVVL